MSLEREFQTILIGSVYATDCQDRWYVAQAPERTSTYPYGVIQLHSAQPHHVHAGPPAIQTRTLRLSIFSTRQDDISAVADQARSLLDGFTGNSGSIVIKGVFFQDQEYYYNEITRLHEMTLAFETTFL